MRKLILTAFVLSIVLAGQAAQASETAVIPNKLAKQARYIASHGGIQGSCWACATQRMQQISRRLVVLRFAMAGQDAVRWSLCVVRRESGFNPGAVNSSSGAAGLFQFLGHPQYDSWKLTHDPVYQVWAAWDLSQGATVRSHWYGGGYNC